MALAFSLLVLVAVLVLVARAPRAWPEFAIAAPGAVGAAGLGILVISRRRVRAAELVRATSPSFLVFVASLAIVVDAAASNGLDRWIADPLPGGSGLVALLAVAAGAALLGVNVGPNLTYTGSLATMLWRREVRRAGVEPSTGEFFRMAWLSTPVALCAAVLALWTSVHLLA